MDKNNKQLLVAELKQVFAETPMVLVVKNLGVNAVQARELRRQIRKTGCSYRVAKNRLAKIALQGTNCESLSDMLVGPTALAYSDDPVAIAKIIAEFAKTNDKLEIVGGAFQGKKLGAAEVKHLATLPSLDELRGTLVGVLAAPATRLATVLQAPAAELARVFNAYAKK